MSEFDIQEAEKMKREKIQATLFDSSEQTLKSRTLLINKSKLLEVLDNLLALESLQELKIALRDLRSHLVSPDRDTIGVLNIDSNGDTVEMKYGYLMGELSQIEQALTLERARYYLGRLKKALTEIKTNRINDINLNRWKEYDEILTDSLWVFDRDKFSVCNEIV